MTSQNSTKAIPTGFQAAIVAIYKRQEAALAAERERAEKALRLVEAMQINPHAIPHMDEDELSRWVSIVQSVFAERDRYSQKWARSTFLYTMLSVWTEGLNKQSDTAQERLATAQEALREIEREIDQWVVAYGPDIITYPSKEELQAVNETPEFVIGRNATMQVVSEGLRSTRDKARAALPKEEDKPSIAVEGQ